MTRRFMTLEDLSPGMRRGLIRCWDSLVLVDEEPRRMAAATLHALLRHQLVFETRDRRNRLVYRPTDRGLELLRSDTPRFLTPAARPGRTEHGYTTDPARAMPDEPEAVDAETQERIAKGVMRSREDEAQRNEALAVFAALQQQREEFRRLATAKGVNISSDLRVIERRICAIKRRLGDYAGA